LGINASIIGYSYFDYPRALGKAPAAESIENLRRGALPRVSGVGAYCRMTPQAMRAPELPAGSVL